MTDGDFEALQVLRFEKSYEYDDKPRGYSCTYRVKQDDGTELLMADMVRHGTHDVTLFRDCNDGSVAFSIHPERMVLNLTYELRDGPKGPTFGGLWQRVGSRRALWCLLDREGVEVAAYVDPASLSEQVLTQALQGARQSFALAANGKEVGTLVEEARPEAEAPAAGFMGFIQKFLKPRDWVLRMNGATHPGLDPRQVIAASVMIQETNVLADKAG